MSTLMWILFATLAGGVLSVAGAALFAFAVLERWVPRLVSFAVGVLLGAAFLNLLPEAVAAGLPVEQVLVVVLGGILVFFVLEKLALWRHEHAHLGGDAVDRRPAGLMILLGDGLHNFVDGILIAAAFLQSVPLGVATTVAVIAHEIPQEIGDFLILLDSGYGKRKALLLNALSSLTAVAGGLLGYLLLRESQTAIPYALALAAASFIYIAVADLVPELHRGREPGPATVQFSLILIGIGVIFVGHH